LILKKAFKQFQNGDYELSKKNCEIVLSESENNPDALNLLVLILRATKQLGKAEKLVRLALKENPNHPFLSNSLGLLLMDQRRFNEAVILFNNAIKTKKDRIEIICNLGFAYYEMGEMDEAESLFKRALYIDSYYSRAIYGYINLSIAKFDFDTAKKFINLGNKLKLTDPEFITSKAIYFLCNGDLKSSYDLFNKVVDISHEYPDAVVNRGLVSLMQGNINEGWEDYSLRRKRRWNRSVERHHRINKWEGEELENKKILIWSEQGLGEVILSLSLLNNIVDLPDQIFFECDSKLFKLIKKSFPKLKVFSSNENINFYNLGLDYQLSSFELIKFFFLKNKNEKKFTSYLQADDSKVDKIRDEYKSFYGDIPLVGISWASPLASHFYTKNISLNLWDELVSFKEVGIVNLQYGSCRQELNKFSTDKGIKLFSVADDNIDKSFDQLAAHIKALDLVISVSNSTAHLSGGLGQKTWALIPPLGPSSMWYWFCNSAYCPWYPSVTLFRRNAGKDEEFMKNVYYKLRLWAGEMNI